MDAPPCAPAPVTAVVIVMLAAVALAFPMIGLGASVKASRHIAPPAERGSSPRGEGPLVHLGRMIRRQLARPADRAADATLGRSLALVLMLGVVSVRLGVVAALVLAVRPIWLRRAQLNRQRERISNEVPELIDLYAVALQSGHNIATATAEVARRGQGLVAESLRGCLDQVTQGRPLSDALEELPDRLGTPLRPLTAALVASDRDGVPIVDSLAVLAADARMLRRRQAETTARRLPIAMLFPLVVCVLPAFLFLTVLPVLVDALTSLA